MKTADEIFSKVCELEVWIEHKCIPTYSRNMILTKIKSLKEWAAR